MASSSSPSPAALALALPPPPQPLPYAALRTAAAGWHPLAVVGEGGFGKVYRGVLALSDGSVLPVAIKRQAPAAGAGAGAGATGGGATGGGGGGSGTQANAHRQGGAEFANEVALLRRLQHPNLVRLVGWCDPTDGVSSGRGNPFAQPAGGGGGGGERCLVYELCAGGSLDDALRQTHGSSSSSSTASLGWRARLAVAAQAAAAVAALHGARPRPVIHGDVKPANILLLLPDAARAAGGQGGDGRAAGGITAKLADVGLATELGAAAGATGGRGGFGGGTGGSALGGSATAAAAAAATTSGPQSQGSGEVRGDWAYLPPEARARGSVGRASDVFALGVTLLQLATGNVERVHELPLRARLAAAGVAPDPQQQQQQGLAGLLDPRAGAWDPGAGERLLRAALFCCADAPEARPTAAGAAGLLARLHAAAERAAERARIMRERERERERERAEQLAEAWAVL